MQSGRNLLAFRNYLLPPTTTLKMEVAHSSVPTGTSNTIQTPFWMKYNGHFQLNIFKNSINAA
jgi:hypothetical protein